MKKWYCNPRPKDGKIYVVKTENDQHTGYYRKDKNIIEGYLGKWEGVKLCDWHDVVEYRAAGGFDV